MISPQIRFFNSAPKDTTLKVIRERELFTDDSATEIRVWALGIVFPKAFTPICTTELEELAANADRLRRLNTLVFVDCLQSTLEESQDWVNSVAGENADLFPVGIFNWVRSESHAAVWRTTAIVSPTLVHQAELAYPDVARRPIEDILQLLEKIQQHSECCKDG